MADYPYAIGTGKIPLLFSTIGEKGIPPKVTVKWLGQFGMTSSNDARLIPVLRFIGFTDANNAPTQRWRDYRGTDSRQVIGEAVRDGYSELFHAYPEAQSASPDQLATFFRSNTDLGGEAISKAVTTFRSLAGLADFSSAISHQRDTGDGDSGANSNGDREVEKPPTPPRTNQPPVVINVNLQLTLPASNDPAVYDALFASLNKNVLSAGTDSDA